MFSFWFDTLYSNFREKKIFVSKETKTRKASRKCGEREKEISSVLTRTANWRLNRRNGEINWGSQ
jgi:hypothetical protein